VRAAFPFPEKTILPQIREQTHTHSGAIGVTPGILEEIVRNQRFSLRLIKPTTNTPHNFFRYI